MLLLALVAHATEPLRLLQGAPRAAQVAKP